MIGRLIGLFTGIGPAISGASLLVKFGLIAGLFTAGALAYGTWRHNLIKEGRTQAINEIAQGNAEMIQRARIARNKVVACRTADREWDQVTGDCK